MKKNDLSAFTLCTVLGVSAQEVVWQKDIQIAAIVMVGVTTITPSSGIRELYVYDSANRLKQVQVRERDHAGTYSYKVVKEFRYHYKQ